MVAMTVASLADLKVAMWVASKAVELVAEKDERMAVELALHWAAK